jgi:hypothetical protein
LTQYECPFIHYLFIGSDGSWTVIRKKNDDKAIESVGKATPVDLVSHRISNLLVVFQFGSNDSNKKLFNVLRQFILTKSTKTNFDTR